MTSIYNVTTNSDAVVELYSLVPPAVDISEWVSSITLTPNENLQTVRIATGNGINNRTLKTTENLTGEITVVVTPGGYDELGSINPVGFSAYPALLYWSRNSLLPDTQIRVSHNQPDTLGLVDYTVRLGAIGSPEISISNDGIAMATFPFVAAQYTVLPNPFFTFSYSVVGQGAVTPVNGSFHRGGSPFTTIDVEALNASGWRFDSWSGDLTGTTNPTTLLMDGNKSVTATFLELFDLTISFAGTGSGTVSFNNSGDIVTFIGPTSGSEAYLDGTVVTVSVLPTTGTFSGWSGDLTGTANPTTITMDGSKSITATFTA